MPERPTKIGPKPAADLYEAAHGEQAVILYCLVCGRSRRMHAWALAGLLGAAPFGIIIGNLRCKGCGRNVGVVLPWQAPTPEQFARINRVSARAVTRPRPVLPRHPAEHPAGDFQLDIWNKGGGIERRLAVIDNLQIGHSAFEEAMRQYPNTNITLHARTQTLRDSARAAVKPVR
jgi:hypothetical protein